MEIIKTRTITSFIASENREEIENVWDFSIDYPDNVLVRNPNEFKIELNVLSFDMPYTMYNINNSNNKFEIITDGNTVLFTIKSGNYTVYSLLKEIKNLINDSNLLITYNEAQNTYTFKKLTASITYKFKSVSMNKILGINNDQEYDITNYDISTFETGLINLVDYNKVIVHTKGINYYYSNIENLQGNNKNSQLFSDIIFWKSKSDVQPYQILKYNNEDGGNSFVYEIKNDIINRITFQLKNERGEYITDAQDYHMVIQFNFYQKKDTLTILNKIDITLKEIYNSILYLLNRLKLLS